MNLFAYLFVCLFVRLGSPNLTTTNTLNPFSSSSFAVMGKCVPLPVPLRPTSHFPKTAKEELEQGFNALVVVESRLPTRRKFCQIMSKNYEIICLHLLNYMTRFCQSGKPRLDDYQFALNPFFSSSFAVLGKCAPLTEPQQIFTISFSPSHPSEVTKTSSSNLATSGITSPSMAQKGESLVI